MASRPEKWDLEVDFIAVGSGGGAVTAAIVAHDMGKTVSHAVKPWRYIN